MLTGETVTIQPYWSVCNANTHLQRWVTQPYMCVCVCVREREEDEGKILACFNYTSVVMRAGTGAQHGH